MIFDAVFRTRVPRRTSVRGIGPAKQVTERLAAKQGEPTPPLVLVPIVQHVTALAERREAGIRIVARVVIPVRGRQHDPRCAHMAEEILYLRPPAKAPSLIITPGAALGVPPVPVAKVTDPR